VAESVKAGIISKQIKDGIISKPEEGEVDIYQ